MIPSRRAPGDAVDELFGEAGWRTGEPGLLEASADVTPELRCPGRSAAADSVLTSPLMAHRRAVAECVESHLSTTTLLGIAVIRNSSRCWRCQAFPGHLVGAVRSGTLGEDVAIPGDVYQDPGAAAGAGSGAGSWVPEIASFKGLLWARGWQIRVPDWA